VSLNSPKTAEELKTRIPETSTKTDQDILRKVCQQAECSSDIPRATCGVHVGVYWIPITPDELSLVWFLFLILILNFLRARQDSSRKDNLRTLIKY
jgi:hypothetical protein